MSVSRHGAFGIRQTGEGSSLKMRLPELVNPTSGSEKLSWRANGASWIDELDWLSSCSFARTEKRFVSKVRFCFPLERAFFRLG